MSAKTSCKASLTWSHAPAYRFNLQQVPIFHRVHLTDGLLRIDGESSWAELGARWTAIVWSADDCKETLYDFLATQLGKNEHSETKLRSIIEPFEGGCLEPFSKRLGPK